MANNFKEGEHPRDGMGRFSYGENSEPIVVRGDELGGYKDSKDLARKATNYYRENIQGKSVMRDDIGKVVFARVGIDETVHTARGNSDILKAIPYIMDIVKHGENRGEVELKHPRTDGTTKIISLSSKITMDSKLRTVRVLLLKRPDNKYYYTMYMDLDKKKSDIYGNMIVNNQAYSRVSNSSIIQNSSEVNSPLTLNLSVVFEEPLLASERIRMANKKYSLYE
ncbi:hypothetical protein FACS1894152_4210 [Bacilli bacterium]|nr:hypothetical protein FACS1894152_4210 [Bacilli bacterium]